MTRASPSPQSACWFDNDPVADGPAAFDPPHNAHTNGSFSCWLHSHPQTPTGPTTHSPDAQATALFAPPRRAAAARRRAAFFLQLNPNRRSHRSTVEVPKGRSRRWPNSASVASGCSVTSFASRPWRARVSSVLRPHKWVCGWSVPRAWNCCRTRLTAATQNPENVAMSRVLLPWS